MSDRFSKKRQFASTLIRTEKLSDRSFFVNVDGFVFILFTKSLVNPFHTASF